MPQDVEGDELHSEGKSLGSLQDQLEYLEVNGVNQHQGCELIDGSLGDDVFDAAFRLISDPVVDAHSGLLGIFLKKTRSNL